MRSIGIDQMHYTVDLDSVRHRKKIVEKCRYYGIPTAFFSNDKEEIYTEYEKKAIEILEQGKELPEDIKDNLIKTLKERQERNRKLGIQ